MSKNNQQIIFTEIHHALLFAWIAKAVFAQAGEQPGEAIIRKATRLYGEQRGRRVALRAHANKQPPSMLNYIAYSEYRITPGAMEFKITERIPHARLQTIMCPWYAAWKDDGLLAYGRLYCAEIDSALLRGFNPQLQVDVIATLPAGAPRCEFVYHNANLSVPRYLLVQYRRAISPGLKVVKPWDYHVGHLFTTLEDVIVKELGQVGQEAVQAGLDEFAKRYGEQAMQSVVTSQSKDYASVSEE